MAKTKKVALLLFVGAFVVAWAYPATGLCAHQFQVGDFPADYPECFKKLSEDFAAILSYAQSERARIEFADKHWKGQSLEYNKTAESRLRNDFKELIKSYEQCTGGTEEQIFNQFGIKDKSEYNKNIISLLLRVLSSNNFSPKGNVSESPLTFLLDVPEWAKISDSGPGASSAEDQGPRQTYNSAEHDTHPSEPPKIVYVKPEIKFPSYGELIIIALLFLLPTVILIIIAVKAMNILEKALAPPQTKENPEDSPGPENTPLLSPGLEESLRQTSDRLRRIVNDIEINFFPAINQLMNDASFYFKTATKQNLQNKNPAVGPQPPQAPQPPKPRPEEEMLAHYNSTIATSPKEFQERWKPEHVWLDNFSERSIQSSLPPKLRSGVAAWKANFWMAVPKPGGEKYLFPNRDLYNNWPALMDDPIGGSDCLFGGIFDIVPGKEFMLEKPAKLGPGLSIAEQGVLRLPIKGTRHSTGGSDV